VQPMPDKRLYLIAGLGNPGTQYADTRHNAGFMVVETLADRHRITIQREKFNVAFGRGRIGTAEVVLAKPLGYMNRSGPPLQQLAHFFKIEREALIVVHDDIDLAFYRLKIKEKGGDGGHKGIKSIIESFGGSAFTRVRLGVGRSDAGSDVVGHVLGKFSPDEKAALDDLLPKACDAIETILNEGTKVAMNRFNQNLS